MKILIVKHGALGDVVRTSYFAGPLRRKYGPSLTLSWITSPAALPLLSDNPYIDRLYTSFEPSLGEVFDTVYSLDDEEEVLNNVALLQSRRIVGAYRAGDAVAYSMDSSAWFDMGLRSRFGKQQADNLKKQNSRGHADIFTKIFEVDGPEPRFYGDPSLQAEWSRWLNNQRPAIGVNPFAGGRWPAKELRASEVEALVVALLAPRGPLARSGCIILIGAGDDRLKNLALANALADPRIRVANSDPSPLHLGALARELDFMITSDSLAMHLAIAQGVPTVAFFAPTSAVEIDDFGLMIKVVSTAPDYCSYGKDADNSTITHLRVLDALDRLRERRG